LPRNPDVAESKFACTHFNIKQTSCHSIMRDSVILPGLS
jgi:hypothetical protein